MKPFTRIAVVVLWLIALVQLLRFILRWEVTLNGAPVPLWLSGLVAALAAGLAVMVWRERSRGCWEATGAEGFVVRVAVVETADGTGDTWVGHTISDNLGAGAVETVYFRMLDLLADRLRQFDPRGNGGWEVGCRACGEGWPCPVREIAAHPGAVPRADVLDHVPYGVIRHG